MSTGIDAYVGECLSNRISSTKERRIMTHLLARRLIWEGLSVLAVSVAQCAEAQPTIEFVTAEQVGTIAVFHCLDAAAKITGGNTSIDGGWTAG
jgi:enoyl-[acyl-carrier-protein] reductase (NADH)